MTREYQRAWYAKNRVKVCRQKRLAHARRYATNPEKFRAYTRKSRAKVRAEFIAAYGGKCTCCGEAEPAFLTLEHMNRDGAAQRKEIGHTSTQQIAHLRRLGWPKENHTLLCFNCNRASWELGVCPHQRQEGMTSQ